MIPLDDEPESGSMVAWICFLSSLLFFVLVTRGCDDRNNVERETAPACAGAVFTPDGKGQTHDSSN